MLEQPDGRRQHAAVLDCEHATLCAAFGLDPASTLFDLPETMRDSVKLHAAFRAGRGHGRDRVFGFALRGRDRAPIGRLHMLPKSGVRHRELYGWRDKIEDTR
jgi:hypothetical protein